MNTFNILKEKGYSGSDNFYEMIDWLNQNGVFIDFNNIWSEDGTSWVGYTATFWFIPYESSFSTAQTKTLRDAFESGVIALKDYIYDLQFRK